MSYGEEKEFASIRKLAILTCGSKIWDELHLLMWKEMLVEEQADELAKAGAMLDAGFMAQTRAKTVQQEREGVRSLAVRSQLTLLGGRNRGNQAMAKRKVDLCGQEMRRNEASNGMVCCCQQAPMREMWKGPQVHEDARKNTGPKYLAKNLE